MADDDKKTLEEVYRPKQVDISATQGLENVRVVPWRMRRNEYRSVVAVHTRLCNGEQMVVRHRLRVLVVLDRPGNAVHTVVHSDNTCN